jgi:hypothetical protein
VGTGFPKKIMLKQKEKLRRDLKMAKEFIKAPAFARYGPIREEET